MQGWDSAVKMVCRRFRPSRAMHRSPPPPSQMLETDRTTTLDPQARLAVLVATTGLTQLDLVKLLGVASRTVRRWMQGVCTPRRRLQLRSSRRSPVPSMRPRILWSGGLLGEYQHDRVAGRTERGWRRGLRRRNNKPGEGGRPPLGGANLERGGGSIFKSKGEGEGEVTS
jgi:hypothetical protein